MRARLTPRNRTKVQHLPSDWQHSKITDSVGWSAEQRSNGLTPPCSTLFQHIRGDRCFLLLRQRIASYARPCAVVELIKTSPYLELYTCRGFFPRIDSVPHDIPDVWGGEKDGWPNTGEPEEKTRARILNSPFRSHSGK